MEHAPILVLTLARNRNRIVCCDDCDAAARRVDLGDAPGDLRCIAVPERARDKGAALPSLLCRRPPAEIFPSLLPEPPSTRRSLPFANGGRSLSQSRPRG